MMGLLTGMQADKLLMEQADQRDHKRLEKTTLEKKYVARRCPLRSRC